MSPLLLIDLSAMPGSRLLARGPLPLPGDPRLYADGLLDEAEANSLHHRFVFDGAS